MEIEVEIEEEVEAAVKAIEGIEVIEEIEEIEEEVLANAETDAGVGKDHKRLEMPLKVEICE